jgi:hypothetical protein
MNEYVKLNSFLSALLFFLLHNSYHINIRAANARARTHAHTHTHTVTRPPNDSCHCKKTQTVILCSYIVLVTYTNVTFANVETKNIIRES